MPDDIERRMHADAARQRVVDPPPLGPAVARATARGGKPVLASLAVAASVVLVGGAVAALAGGSSGGDGSAAGDASGYRLRGLLQEDSRSQPDVVTVLIDTGTCATDSGATRDSAQLSVRLVSETATTVHIAVAASSTPSAGASLTPINDILTPDVGDPSQVITPRVPNLDVTGSAGSTGPNVAVGAGTCAWKQIDGAKVHLAAPPGDRKFFVDDRPMIVLDGQFPATDAYLPSGYHETGADTPQNDRLLGFSRGTDAAGDIVGVDYGPPQFVASAGTVIGHADVNGHQATLTEAPGERAIYWLLDSGARVRLFSRAQHPLSTAELEAGARRLH